MKIWTFKRHSHIIVCTGSINGRRLSPYNTFSHWPSPSPEWSLLWDTWDMAVEPNSSLTYSACLSGQSGHPMLAWITPQRTSKGWLKKTLNARYSKFTNICSYVTSIVSILLWVKIDYVITGLNCITGINFSMRPANERRCYNVTSSLIGWAHTKHNPWYQYRRK